MIRAERRVDAAKNDFCGRCEGAKLSNDFCYAGVPVSHAGLHERVIERRVISDKVLKCSSRQAEAAETAPNGCENCRLVTVLGVKLAAAPVVAPVIPGRHSPIETIEEVKDRELRFSAQEASGAQEPVRLQPKIIGRKVIDRWIDEKDARRHMRCGGKVTPFDSTIG